MRDWADDLDLVQPPRMGVGFKELEDLGWLRVNLDAEGYLALPTKKLTQNQYYSLELLMDKYLKKFTIFEVATIGSYKRYTINQDDVFDSIEYIIDRIKRYYSTGKLYENVN